ncbi:DUF397 domain-containing protein [Streptosporangium amethystogenes subsp. fukuiense]|uniref:DUF397 domain-containing protein n=1 Tax=Streptosporangium amethystogenes subsp. fukuiense TaxID=698418 RepID=A0ABW2TF40_9ACTN
MQPDLSGARWRKSSLSADGASCVEMAFVGNDVAVRDTKNRDGGTLIFHRNQWTTFINGIKNSDFAPLP